MTATCSGSASFDHDGRLRTAFKCRTFMGLLRLFNSIMVAAVSHWKLVIPGAPPTSPLTCPDTAAKLKLVEVTAVRTYPPAHAVLFPSSVNVELYFAALPVVNVRPKRNTVFPMANL